jgi:hypothetical protein
VPGAPPSENWNSLGVTRRSSAGRPGVALGGVRSLRNPSIRATVAAGRSSINQWPAPGTTASRTSVATLRMTTAWIAPNDFSPPMASTGMVSFVR